ncbi:MAG: hypothetical protein JXD22_07550 [Sedimentisphaerales bacterium]|nr:hypothetical protein [Sedimentisphaerales bacterium]
MFKKLIGRRPKSIQDYDIVSKSKNLSISEPDNDGVVFNVNVDGFRENEKDELYSTAIDKSGLTLFEGHVEHAYDMGHVAQTDQCPRCHAPTRQQYGHFIYATQIAPRAMFAPAGYFCTKCSCVIIDEVMIRSGIMDRRCKYQGILGLDYKGKEQPEFFRTWNGKETVYIMDENQMLVGLSNLDSGHSHTSQLPAGNRQRKKKNRRKVSRKTRRMNRKK